MTRSTTRLRSSRETVSLLSRFTLLVVLTVAAGCGDGPESAVRHADELFAAARWEEAAAAYTNLPEEAGRWRAYGAWRAAALYRDALQDVPRAEEAFAACARQWQDDEWGYTCTVDQADLMRDAGRPRDAIGAYRSALALRPKGIYAEHCLLESGRSYLLLSEPEQARVEWDELLQNFPGSPLAPTVALEVARSFDVQRDGKGALEAYRAVQERFPAHPVSPLAAFGEGEVLEQLGRLDEAEATFERVVPLHPNPAAVRIKLEAVRQRRERRGRDTRSVMDQGVDLSQRGK